MNNRLLFATRNWHKKDELAHMLAGLNIQVLTLNDVAPLPEIEEDGLTFEDNAVKKARVTAAQSGCICLADDSGLEVDALDGQPGVFSARFAGPDANDRKNNEKLLRLLSNVEVGRRTARFVCVIAISDPAGNTSTVKGICPGRIGLRPKGEGGFGYDPLFIPDGFDLTFAELSPQEKNNISHRGMALRKAIPIIKALYAQSQPGPDR